MHTRGGGRRPTTREPKPKQTDDDVNCTHSVFIPVDPFIALWSRDEQERDGGSISSLSCARMCEYVVLLIAVGLTCTNTQLTKTLF